MMVLELLINDGTMRRIALKHGQTLSVGRTARADVVVADPQISSLHFTIVHGPRGYWLHDRNSTNGTQLNGRAVIESGLRSGDTIQAGETTFRVTAENEKPPSDRSSTLRSTMVASGTKSPRSQEVAAPEPARTSAETTPDVVTKGKDGSHVDVQRLASTDEPDDLVTPRLQLECPQKWSAALLPWEWRPGDARLTIVAKTTFTLEAAPVQLQEAHSVLAADQVDDEDPTVVIQESDLVPFKPKADVLVIGDAVAPNRQGVPQLDVSIRVGPIVKTVRIFGDRRWSYPTRVKIVPTFSAPKPFRTMPIVWQRAFGGIDAHAASYCDDNLSGTGWIGALSPSSIHDLKLPNIEDLQHLITAWDSRPQPTGLGCVSRSAAWRRQMAGSYDHDDYTDATRQEPPEGASLAVHNCAPPDQQIDGYLQGGEAVELVHLTEHSPLRFVLPKLGPTVTVHRALPSSGSVNASEVRFHWDTLILRTRDGVFDCVFRAVVPLASLDEPDVVLAQIQV